MEPTKIKNKEFRIDITWIPRTDDLPKMFHSN